MSPHPNNTHGRWTGVRTIIEQIEGRIAERAQRSLVRPARGEIPRVSLGESLSKTKTNGWLGHPSGDGIAS